LVAGRGPTPRGPRRAWVIAKLALTPLWLAIAVLGLVGADAGSQLAGDSLFPGGPFDETAHLLTTLLFLWAAGGAALERLGLPALIASFLIDVDHVPSRLGVNWITAGTPRPYTHSLLTVALVLVGAGLWRRNRDLLLGIAIGLALHFWRDTGEPGSGVALLWPWSDHAFSYSHWIYLAAMVVVVAVDALRCLSAPGARPRRIRASFSLGRTRRPSRRACSRRTG
jgi:inner membrane protein